MSTLPQRQVGVFITIGLAVVGALVAGIILFTSGKATEIDLTTAKYVPDDAGLYVALNTDLTSDQWVATFALIERLGQDDPEEELKDGAEDLGGIDWEDDVVPFLGGNAAVYLRVANTEDAFDNFDAGAVIVKAQDAEKALDVIEDTLDANFDEDEYEGAAVYIEEDLDIYIAIHDGHMIFASNQEALFDSIDAGTGKDPNLTSVQDFRTLRDELTKNFLVFVYVNGEDLFGDFLDDEGSLFSEAFAEAGVYDLTLKPNAWVLGAKKDSFEAQHAALGEPGAIGPMTTARDSKLARLMPGETSFFFTSYQVSQAYHQAVDDAREKIDEALRDQSEYDDLDEALEAAGEEVGLDNIEELIDLFRGEVAVAVWFPDNNEDEPEVVFAADVQDEAEARDVIERMVDESGGSTRTEDINGVEVTYFKDDDGDEAGYAIKDKVVYFGTQAGLDAVLDPQGPRLTEMARYKATLESVPTKLGTYAYFDVAALLRLESAGSIPELDEFERALEGAIVNVVNERDVVRTSGSLTIKE